MVISTKQENFHASALLISVNTVHTFVVYASNFCTKQFSFRRSAFLGSDMWAGRNTAELTSVFLQRFVENASERLALQLPKYPPQNLTQTYRSTQIQIWLPLSGPQPTVCRSNDSWSLHVFRTAYTQWFIT